MRAWHILGSRLRSLVARNRREDDLAEELRLHIERQTEAWIAQGIDPDEARQRARRQFGNLESLKEESRDARGLASWDSLVRDLRQAARRLVRDARFSAPAVLLLAIGIGANTAIFSIVNATLLRPSPFADVERLVEVYQNTREGAPGTNSYPAYLDMAAVTNVFEGVSATTFPIPVSYREGNGPVRRGVAEYASASYPAVLGIRPALGRWFTAAEARAGMPVVAVLGHQAWTRRFRGDPGIVGRVVHVQGMPVTIVGVGPAGYRGTLNVGTFITDFWMPAESGLGVFTGVRVPDGGPFFVKARLRGGVTVAQAQAAMDGLGRRLAAEYPEQDAGTGISVFPTTEVRFHPEMDTLITAIASIVLSVVSLVMALACSSLATLLLVRAAARAKEVSIRLAIGATRWQVVRHLLAESVLLSLAGGAAGAVLAWWLIRVLRAIELPITVEFGIDAAVLAYAVLLSLVTGVLFGLAPALKATRLDLLPVIRGEGLAGSAGRRWFTLRNGLVVFQVTASVVLLTATGAFLQMGAAARAQQPGFAVKGVAWVQTEPSYSGYTPDRAAGVFAEFERRVAALPGVAAVTTIGRAPMENASATIVIEDTGTGERAVNAGSRLAAPGFFDVMQVPLLFGRAFDARDRQGSPPVAVIDESMARTYFGGVNAVGRRFRSDVSNDWIEVVGVARDTATNDPTDVAAGGEQHVFFLPSAQARTGAVGSSGAFVVARTTGDAGALVREMQRALAALDPTLPVLGATTMEELIREMQAGPAVVAMALGGLGALGLGLAGLGLYAVIAFAVARRAREIGVRMALGASRIDVATGVARDAGIVLSAGAGVGLLLAVMVILGLRASSDMSAGIVNINFRPPSVDPLQLSAIVVFVLVVGVAAAFVPARRASRMSPLDALRRE